jgi:hypothetical protein
MASRPHLHFLRGHGKEHEGGHAIGQDRRLRDLDFRQGIGRGPLSRLPPRGSDRRHFAPPLPGTYGFPGHAITAFSRERR